MLNSPYVSQLCGLVLFLVRGGRKPSARRCGQHLACLERKVWHRLLPGDTRSPCPRPEFANREP